MTTELALDSHKEAVIADVNDWAAQHVGMSAMASRSLPSYTVC